MSSRGGVKLEVFERLELQGMSEEEVMERYGVAKGTARRWLFRRGLREECRERAGHSSPLGKRLRELGPEEFSRRFVPDKHRKGGDSP